MTTTDRQWAQVSAALTLTDAEPVVVTGFSHRGKSILPDRLTVEVRRSDEGNAAAVVTAFGFVLKKDDSVGQLRTECVWSTERGYFRSARDAWEDMPSWVRALAEPIAREWLACEIPGIPAAPDLLAVKA